MKIYNLHKEQYLPISIEKAWEFFSNASNLSKITPPGMKFVILTDLKDGAVHSGMKIDYTVSPLFYIPLRWTTEIIKVDQPHTFTDVQVKGPYLLWVHRHTFEWTVDGVKMTDHVKYALPFGWLGTVAHSLFIKQKLDSIFNFREKTLVNLFGPYKNDQYVAN